MSKTPQISFTTYILKCSDGSLYAGSTTDLQKRLHQHNNLKSGAKYTRSRRPVELVHSESFATLKEAKQREYQIKCLTRQQKLELLTKNKTHPTTKRSVKQKST